MLHMGNLVRDTIGTEEQKILLERFAVYFSHVIGMKITTVRGFIRRALADGIRDGLKSIKDVSLCPAEERLKRLEDVLKRMVKYMNVRYEDHIDECLRIYKDWKKEFNIP